MNATDALRTPARRTVIGAVQTNGQRIPFQSRPLLSKSFDAFAGRIAAEDRTDHMVPLGSLAMNQEGQLLTIGPGPAAPIDVTRNAFGQLGERLAWPAGGTPYLAASPADLRADNVNRWIAEKRSERGAQQVRLRERTFGGRREAFALLTDRYHVYDAAEFFGALKSALPATARGAFHYDGSRAEMEATFQNVTIPVGARKVGDIFEVGIRGRTSDDGTGGYIVEAFAGRLACTNGMVVRNPSTHARTSHLRRSLVEYVAQAVADAQHALGDLPALWTAAAEDQILDGIHGTYDPEQVFRKLISGGHVTTPVGVDDDEMVRRLNVAWSQEPGGTRADVINAITRAAHVEAWHDQWTTAALEEQAGALLYKTISVADDRLSVSDLDLG